VIPMERRRQVTLAEIESTGYRRNSLYCRKAAAFQGWQELENRGIQLRFWDGLGVKFPGPTRRRATGPPMPIFAVKQLVRKAIQF
jgi:hypothetical protein